MYDMAMRMSTIRGENMSRSQKLESIGTLAGGVAHDFNNILTVIIGACTLLEMNAADYPEQMPFVSRIRNYAERAAQLTQDLLVFSRRQAVVMKPEDLAELFHDMHRFLGSIVGEDIQLITDQQEKTVMVMVDRGQIEQVLMNLAANSRDAMPCGGVLRMRLSRVTNDGALPHLEGYPLGDYALITVSDTGTGIDRENLCRIYEPYFTTKELHAGAGLGLSVVYGIISQHDGVICVQSSPGEGTTFSIYLPICDQEVLVMSEAGAVRLPGGTETILLVDSDPVMLKLNGSLLEETGYMVLTASDALEAQELLRRGQDAISLVVLDSALLSALELESCWRQIVNDDKIKFILLQGADDAETACTMKGAVRIRKPFDPLLLLEQIRALIDGRAL
jgi:nitrogen-specific signal transduction histidine kinase